MGKTRPSTTPHSTKPGGTHMRSLVPFNEKNNATSHSHMQSKGETHTHTHFENADTHANVTEGYGRQLTSIYIHAPTDLWP